MAFTRCEGTVAFAQSRQGELRVNNALAGHHAPDSARQLGRRRVLEQEADRAVFHGLAQIATAPKGRQDYHAAGRELFPKRHGRTKPIAARHFDIQQRYIGAVFQRGRHNVRAAAAPLPPDIIAKLNAELVRNLKNPDVAAHMASDGAEVIGSSPNELATALREDYARWAKPVRDSGARVD